MSTQLHHLRRGPLGPPTARNNYVEHHPVFQSSLDRINFGRAFAPPIPGRYSVRSPASSYLSCFLLSIPSFRNIIIANCAIADGSDISLGYHSFSWWASSPHSYRVATPPVLQRVPGSLRILSEYSSRSLLSLGHLATGSRHTGRNGL
jgi:hypothetical protein